MKSFYDKLVPQRLNKLVAQYDKEAKVAPHSHSLQGKDGEVKAHSIEITPKLRAAILKGLPAFKSGGAIGLQPMFIEDPEQAGRRLIEWAFATAPLFHRADGGQVVHPSKKTKSDKKSASPIASRALDVVYKLPK